MSLKVLPRISREGIVLPAWSVALYPMWMAMVWLVLMGTGSIRMQYTAIPADELVMTVLAIVGTALILFAVLYLVGYQEKKSKVLELKALALKNGTAVDEISIAKVESFNNIYVCALLLGAGISAVIAYLGMISVIPNAVTLAGPLDYVLYAIASVIVAGLVLDKFFVHPIADGTFKSKVIDPLTNAIIDQFQDDDKKAPALSDDQMTALITALQNAIKKD